VTALIVANALAWVAIAILVVAVLALARQVGVLHERVAPMGALTMDHGPEVGSAAPVFDLPALGGAQLSIGRATGRPVLLFFLSPTCPVCKKLVPVLRSLRAGEAGLDVILASDGEQAEHLAFYKREKLAPFPYVLSAALGMTFRISKLPYAVLIGPDGKIAAKGLVNTREQIESLLVAHEMGVASLQDFVSRDTPQGNGAQGGERIRNAVV
jgi:methylamine dehydrogenase accessory protein MauD